MIIKLRDKDSYILSVSPCNKYKDEISVIVKLDKAVEGLKGTYVKGEQQLAGAKWSENPRITPRPLNSKDKKSSVWFVSINPYLGVFLQRISYIYNS